MNEADELLRSAFAIAQRNGKETNWEAFQNNVKNYLMRHYTLLEVEDEQTVLRATCTPKTYRTCNY